MQIDKKLVAITVALVTVAAVGQCFQLGSDGGAGETDDKSALRSRMIREARMAGKKRAEARRAVRQDAKVKVEREKPRVLELEGTPEAKALMPEAIEFFTGEDNLRTVEDVENWLAENPDGEDDDDLYGGDTDE